MQTNDDFLSTVDKYYWPLQVYYNDNKDNKPIMEISLPSDIIYAYPYTEYIKAINIKCVPKLEEEYSYASENNKMVVFVRDEDNGTLKSILVPIEEIDSSKCSLMNNDEKPE
jgi:hypothetical protein